MEEVFASGVENTGVLDLIGHDSVRDEVVLVMRENRPWDGSDERLFQLQEKINTYTAFALDGEMTEVYPAYAGKKVRIQLNCPAVPDGRTLDFLENIRGHLIAEGVDFVVQVRERAEAPGGDCGQGTCGCKGG
jgi:hypothetical protein